MSKLSHFNDDQAQMVDVSSKSGSLRTARAHAFVKISPDVLAQLPQNPKGNPLEVARFAAIMAAKQTSDLIPMCHPLPLSYVNCDLRIEPNGVRIECEARTTGPTGVEMEALTGAALAALTVYDMTKALDKGIEIQDLYLLSKAGGKSGDYLRKL